MGVVLRDELRCTSIPVLDVPLVSRYDGVNSSELIDDDVYLIAGIQPAPGSPVNDEDDPDRMWRIVTLDREYADSGSARKLFAMGARPVAPSFPFELPNDLIWAGDGDHPCLPCYPVKCGDCDEGERADG